MTDDEILEKLREHFQTKVNNLHGDDMAEGPFLNDADEAYGDTWEAAAKVIDRRGGLRIRFEFANGGGLLDRAATLIEDATRGLNDEGADDERQWLREYRAAFGLDEATAAAAQQREERAAAEARTHDNDPGTAERRVWRTDDPEPHEDGLRLADRDGDVWVQLEPESWSCNGDDAHAVDWDSALRCGPLTEVLGG